MTTPPLLSKTCPICTEPFTRRHGERRHKFTERITCSYPCQMEHRRRKRKNYPPRTCPSCGVQFTRTEGQTARLWLRQVTCKSGPCLRYRGPNKVRPQCAREGCTNQVKRVGAVHCSDTCRNPPRPPRVCELEGCDELVTRRESRFHSHACSAAARRGEHGAEPKVCITCAKTFTKPNNVTRAAWDKREVCSRACRYPDAGKPKAKRVRTPKEPKVKAAKALAEKELVKVAKELAAVVDPATLWRPGNLGRDVRPRLLKQTG